MKIKALKDYKAVFRGLEYDFPAGVSVEVPEVLGRKLLGNPRLSGLFQEA
jgi:hypothetical protein